MSNKEETYYAVIIHFIYGYEDWEPIYELEKKLEEILVKQELGVFDGHELAMDNTDGTLFFFGPNAEHLFKAIKPTLEAANFMKGAKALLRFGKSEYGFKEIVVEV